MKIAVLVTCHNRRAKTEKCIKSLLGALEVHNMKEINNVELEIFLTDDGCTDGTAERIADVVKDNAPLFILKGDGNLFWAGGMRFCWSYALKRHKEWSYYLLLNDDVELDNKVFEELFASQSFSCAHFGREGVVSGITCDPVNKSDLTYGGHIWKNKFLATYKELQPSGEPQLCDLTNANILLVPSSVVDEIGIFFAGYQHGIADFDYSNMARKKGIPVILTANFCGQCERDHKDFSALAHKVINMSLKERKAFFNSPLHSSKDYLCFVRRSSPFRWPMVWLGRIMNLYCPNLYYYISGYRF